MKPTTPRIRNLSILLILPLIQLSVVSCNRASHPSSQSIERQSGITNPDIDRAMYWFDSVKMSTLPCGIRHKHALFFYNIIPFVKAGRDVVPHLIPYVTDTSMTSVTFMQPYQGNNPDESDTWLLGEVACYMIEAALRDNPYFTSSGKLEYSGSREQSLEQAARAYTEWFDRCYDSTTGNFTCDENDLPEVAWQYDQGFWELLQKDGWTRNGNSPWDDTLWSYTKKDCINPECDEQSTDLCLITKAICQIFIDDIDNTPPGGDWTQVLHMPGRKKATQQDKETAIKWLEIVLEDAKSGNIYELIELPDSVEYLFAKNGVEIIPDLMPYLDYSYPTRYSHSMLRSDCNFHAMSTLNLDLLTCCLIDMAFLGDLDNHHCSICKKLDCSMDQDSMMKITRKAAKEYKIWFNRCYDPVTKKLIFDKNDLPVAAWSCFEEPYNTCQEEHGFTPWPQSASTQSPSGK